MIQCSRAPQPSSGSKWNTRRCIQYSVSVQNSQPPATSPIASAVVVLLAPSAKSTAIAGPKTTAGTR